VLQDRSTENLFRWEYGLGVDRQEVCRPYPNCGPTAEDLNAGQCLLNGNVWPRNDLVPMKCGPTAEDQRAAQCFPDVCKGTSTSVVPSPYGPTAESLVLK